MSQQPKPRTSIAMIAAPVAIPPTPTYMNAAVSLSFIGSAPIPQRVNRDDGNADDNEAVCGQDE